MLSWLVASVSDLVRRVWLRRSLRSGCDRSAPRTHSFTFPPISSSPRPPSYRHHQRRGLTPTRTMLPSPPSSWASASCSSRSARPGHPRPRRWRGHRPRGQGGEKKEGRGERLDGLNGRSRARGESKRVGRSKVIYTAGGGCKHRRRGIERKKERRGGGARTRHACADSDVLFFLRLLPSAPPPCGRSVCRSRKMRDWSGLLRPIHMLLRPRRLSCPRAYATHHAALGRGYAKFSFLRNIPMPVRTCAGCCSLGACVANCLLSARSQG